MGGEPWGCGSGLVCGCLRGWKPDGEDGVQCFASPEVETWGLGEGDKEDLGVSTQGGCVEQSR